MTLKEIIPINCIQRLLNESQFQDEDSIKFYTD
jgi:hypothetical protein